MSEGVHVVLLPSRMRSAEEMRTGYVKAAHACMDGVSLRPILPGQSRRELYCPHCQAESCPFGHISAPEPLRDSLPAREGDWLTLEEAAELTGRALATLYDAIYFRRVHYFALRGSQLSHGRRDYRLYRPDLIRRYGKASDQEEVSIEQALA